MIKERNIREIGPRVPYNEDPRRDISFEKRTVASLTKAFLTSHSTHEFGEKIEEFIDDIEVAWKFFDVDGESLEEFVIHLIPDQLLDRLPLEMGDTKIASTGHVHELRLTYTDPSGRGYEDILQKKALLKVFALVRQRVQDLLKQKELAQVHVVDKQYTLGKGVYRLHDGNVYKDGKEGYENVLPPILRKLYQLPERSPYLAYPTLLIGKDGPLGQQIRSELDILTLKDCLERGAISMSRAILSVTDSIRGLLFLKQHHLRLADLDPSNIGIDVQSGRGILFDYDGLREEGIEADYLAKAAYMPLEMMSPRAEDDSSLGWMRASLEDAHAVYELGKTLETICYHFELPFRRSPWNARVEKGELEGCNMLIKRMVRAEPIERPTLEEVLERLSALNADHLDELTAEHFAREKAYFYGTHTPRPSYSVDAETRKG